MISTPRPGALAVLAALAAVACLAYFTVARLNPPAPVADDAPPTEFSSARAMKVVRAISERPHPMGTSANREVRDYLLAELKSMGLAPEVQRATGMNLGWGGIIPAGAVENVLVRLKGTGGGKAVLLMAHYDTVTSAPGAADNGAGVATVIETVRALRAGAPLKNDVIALLTDGEEVGLLGAGAFIREHPWAKDVGLVLNFEARGNGGPSIMFETSERNGWLIDQFAEASPRPVANSLSYELYRLLPFDTDMRPFKESGLPGLNFAFIEGPNHQHNQTDAPEFIDERSVQHHGAQGLALARRFGGAELGAARQGKAVYFDLFGAFLVRYPESWALPLAALVALLCLGVVALGLKRGHLKTSRVAAGAVAFLLGVTLPAAAATFLWWALRTLFPDYRVFVQEHTYNGGLFMLSFLAFAVAVVAVLYVLFRRRVSAAELAAGGLACWAVPLVLTSLYVPGGSYLFTWPPLFAALGLGYLFAAGGAEPLKGWRSALLLACAAPGVLILAPLTYLMFVSLGMAMIAPTLALAALLLTLVLPPLQMFSGRGRWALPLAACVAGLVFLAAGVLTFSFDREHPRPGHVFYALNADEKRAVWASADREPDEFTSQFLTGGYERGGMIEYIPTTYQGFIRQSAPVAALEPVDVKVVGDGVENGVRTLRLRIASRRQAPHIIFTVLAASDITAALDGRAVERKLGQRLTMNYHGAPPEGFEVALSVKSQEPIKVRAIDVSPQLPSMPDAPFKPRPEHLSVSQMPYGDSSLVTKSFSF
jgi:hypothetical protein